MSDCYYCKWRNGHHDPDCPNLTPANSPERKLYEKGWEDGRQAKPETSDHPAYKLGYGNGMCALEEYENGFDPRFME